MSYALVEKTMFLGACYTSLSAHTTYTLPQKKFNFNVPIFHSAPRFLTLIQGHVDFGVFGQLLPGAFYKWHLV